MFRVSIIKKTHSAAEIQLYLHHFWQFKAKGTGAGHGGSELVFVTCAQLLEPSRTLLTSSQRSERTSVLYS